MVAVGQEQVRLNRCTDAIIYIQPATVLCRQQCCPAVLPIVGAISGDAKERAGKFLSVRRLRLSALWHDNGNDNEIYCRAAGCGAALCQSIARRLEGLRQRRSVASE